MPVIVVYVGNVNLCIPKSVYACVQGLPQRWRFPPDIPIVAVCKVDLHWLHPQLQCICLPGEALTDP